MVRKHTNLVLLMLTRYFFTHTNVNSAVRFCESELAAVRARTIRDVICDNTNVTGLPYDSFRHDASAGDALIVPCSERNLLLPDLHCVPGADCNRNFVV